MICKKLEIRLNHRFALFLLCTNSLKTELLLEQTKTLLCLVNWNKLFYFAELYVTVNHRFDSKSMTTVNWWRH